jgi:hypothetical protein
MPCSAFARRERVRMNNVSFGLRFLLSTALLMLCVAAAAQKSALKSTKDALASVRKREIAEACFVHLQDNGPLLAIPTFFWGAEDCPAKSDPASEQWLSFDIHYPEMARGVWPGAMDLYESHQLGPGKAVDNFPARIIWLFFADDMPRNVTDRWNGPEPQVWQMIEHAKKYAKIGNGGFAAPIIKPSAIKGLLSIRFEDAPMPSPDALIRLKAEGWVYSKGEGSLIEEPSADYELLASCTDSDCTGSVQLKASHIQYRFIIPPRAKSHLVEFIALTNTLVKSWITK